MTGSTIKSTVPSDSVKQVRIMTASNTVVPVFKKRARPPLTPANPQRSGAKQSVKRGWEQQDFHSINPKHDTGWEKLGTWEGMAGKAWTGIQHLMKGIPLEESPWRQWNLTQFKHSCPAPRNGGEQ